MPLSLGIFCKGHLSALSKDYDVIALSSPGEELKKIYREEKIRTIGVFMSREISPITDFFTLLKLIRVFKREKPKMVHSITPKAGILSMLAAKIAKVPVRLHSFTGLLFPTARGIKKLLFKGCDKVICRCATNLVAEGNGVKSDLILNDITKREIRVLGFGNIRGVNLDYYQLNPEINEEAQKIKERLGADEEKFVFLYVGRIVGDKGIDNLVNAFTSLAETNKNLRLLLVGEYENHDPLKAETLNIINTSSRIIKTGWVEDPRPFYAAADILVFPSRREGFPNVVLEAGAMGLASIVTDINGCNEIIADNFNGLIIPRDDLGKLETVMKEVSENPESIVPMAANARNLVAQRFEQSFVIDNLKDYYKEILK